MFFSRYAKFMFAPDDGASGGAGVGTNGADEANDGEVDKTDYKSESAKWEAKYKSLKQDFDKKASALSAKEKAERERMSDEEKRKLEFEEKEQRYQELQKEVYEMRVSTAFAKTGFDEKDYGDIVKKIVEVGGEKSGEFANTLIDFIKKANASAVASAKNALIKDGAVAPKTSTANTDGNAKSDYQLYQENKTKTNNIVEL